MKKLKEKTLESDVLESMSDVCDRKHYKIYTFPPNKMIKGCVAFISGWEEELENALMNREGNDLIEN